MQRLNKKIQRVHKHYYIIKIGKIKYIFSFKEFIKYFNKLYNKKKN